MGKSKSRKRDEMTDEDEYNLELEKLENIEALAKIEARKQMSKDTPYLFVVWDLTSKFIDFVPLCLASYIAYLCLTGFCK